MRVERRGARNGRLATDDQSSAAGWRGRRGKGRVTEPSPGADLHVAARHGSTNKVSRCCCCCRCCFFGRRGQRPPLFCSKNVTRRAPIEPLPCGRATVHGRKERVTKTYEPHRPAAGLPVHDARCTPERRPRMVWLAVTRSRPHYMRRRSLRPHPDFLGGAADHAPHRWTLCIARK